MRTLSDTDDSLREVESVTSEEGRASMESGRFSAAVGRDGLDPDWDEFLANTEGGHHVQSSLWSRIKEFNGWRPVRITIRDGKETVGGAQILVRRVRLFGRVGYVAKGPVVARDDLDLADLLLCTLRDVADREGIRALVVQPPAYGLLADRLERFGFQPFGVETAPSATVVVDLTRDPDEILARMSKGMRNGVRRSQRRGIVTRLGGREDLSTFHGLLQATGGRRGVSIYALEYFERMWDVLAPADGIALFLSELDGEPVSAQICVTFGDTMVAKQIGWSGRHRHRHPNEALDWHAIRWAKECGFRYYDLEGIERQVARALIETGSLPREFLDTPTSYKVRLGGEPRLAPGASCVFANPWLQVAHRHVGIRVLRWPGLERAIARFRTR